MTVSLQYIPEKTTWTGVREIDFTFECSGPGAFEVWLETETEPESGIYDRVQVSPQYYTVTFNGAKPTFVAGTVLLTGVIPDTVSQISLERNTLITQTCDLKNFAPFQMPTLEYMLDKLVMIIQEMMARKCGLSEEVKPLQPYRFEPYAVLPASLVNHSLEIIAFYCAVIIQLGGDCTDNPENT